MNTILETTNNGPPGLSFDPPNLSQHRKQARQTAAIDRPDNPGILFGILIRHNPTNPKDLSGGMEGKHGNISELIYLPDFLDQPEYCFNTGLNRRLRQTLNPRFARGTRRWGAATAMEQGRTTPDLDPQTWNRWFPPFLENNVLFYVPCKATVWQHILFFSDDAFGLTSISSTYSHHLL